MSVKFKISSVAAAISFALLNTTSIQAQEKDNDTEVIEVTGFKASLLKSLNNKRNTDTVSDSIFAEDIGKSADQDIGEALQRVTGVSIQRGQGAGETEGTTVTVRGAGPNLNNISLNGIVLTSNTENQAVDLSAYSADILNSIEVIKTASADQDEGSLGANIELKTFRPLDASKNRRVVELQGRYDDYAEENDYKISGSFSEKFLDETLGVYVTAFKETQSSRRDMFYTDQLKLFSADNAIDQHTGQLTGPVTGYINGQNGFKLFQNNMDRQGFTTSLQWAISDNSELVLGVTQADQLMETDDNTIGSLGSLEPYQDEDLARILDPQDPWLVYNSENQMFTKKLDRQARGRTARLQSGVETENSVYSLEFSHYFTDTLRMDIRGGYSKTKADDDYYSYLNSNNYAHVSDDALRAVDASVIEPTGYDCTSGQCYIVTGTGLVDFGPGQTGAAGESNKDNVITTAYNPDDLNAIHLQQAVSRDRIMTDKQKSLYVDFDWDLDLGPIRKIEFGTKFQKREKDVFNQQYWFEGVPQPLGQDALGIGIDSIRLSQVTDGQTPFGDNFLADLGYARTNNTDGWWTLNARKAFALLFENDNVRTKPKLSNDRQIELDNFAAYAKASFAFLDDTLTGNIGLRYVESEVASLGYSSLDWQNNAVSDRNLIKIATDTSLAACTPTQLYNNGVDDEDGYKLAGGFDANGNWGPIAEQSCYDVDYDLGPAQRSRYADGSVPEDPEEFSSTASNDVDMWLPSMTLNYNLSDDMIVRFAASKTMARPRIDSLKPSMEMREFVWGAGNSTMKLSNPYLEPLESENLDLSYEWYFNEGGALTVALFHKDMSNFEEDASINGHWQDLRGVTSEELKQLDPTSEILIEKPGGKALKYDDAQAQGINCMIDRRHKWQTNALSSSEECDTIIAEVIRNGAGGTNKGIEIGYNQNYDFLNGWMAGLGTAINYTYSDSKTDAETGLLNTELAALPMENISKHTYNVSTFWEQDGNLVRLAYNYRSDSLARRSFESGALWNEGGGQLDLSANYQINDHFTLTFNAVNLNNRKSRQYYTNLTEEKVNIEGNAMEGEANKSRTIREWTSGTVYRLGLRATF
ncbi:TonB-dependent receptor [Saccharobesus litoralis]|uniref:TonB-dependent receptor n=1 Tax=Saccharobesus litoralis TaxID=2172099 RepID=A0A2S0VN64_9ALTE|nr:TonB-dependent receptor [Saccharobesus litoralis]AWB65655.1 TonB-dependent receptor [Saccharobesus litoralis]